MLVIRREQMEALSFNRKNDFDQRLSAHLQKCFPGESARLDEAGLRRFMHYGQRRADVHGFTTERDICKYLDLMMVFGQDFDTDPRLPWASRLLRLKTSHSPGFNMNRLFAAAIEHTRAASGSTAVSAD